MNEELNLDDLKRVWNSQTTEKSYSSKEIFKILKRKSITSVKWVFIISLIEMLLAILLYIVMFSNINMTDYHMMLVKDIGNLAYVYEFLTFVIYGVTFLFIYKFFKSYRDIRIHASVKELSEDIIKFRKVVNDFIYFNLIMLFLIYIISVIPAINKFSVTQDIDWMSAKGVGIIAILIAVFAFMIGILWIYYYLVYGTFQRRLKRNLHNLDSIDES